MAQTAGRSSHSREGLRPGRPARPAAPARLAAPARSAAPAGADRPTRSTRSGDESPRARSARHQTRRRTRNPAGLLLTALPITASAVVGGWLVYTSAQATPAPPTPLPSRTFSPPPEALAAVPTTAAPLPVPRVQAPAQVAKEKAAAAKVPASQPFVDLGDPDSATAPLDKPADKADAMEANRVLIPSLGVYGRIFPAGQKSGELVLPISVNKVSWYERSAPLMADKGTTVLAGHNTYSGIYGAFYPLYKLRQGATVYVSDKNRTVTQWKVVALTYHRKGEIPASVFSTTGPRRLVMITCGGKLLQTDHGRHYEDNVVAQAVPVSTS